MPKKRNSQEMIQRILDAALELFRTKGYEETTILDIVNAMKVSRGAFYHHFKSKEEVLFALLARQESNDETALFKEILQSDKLTGIEKVRKSLARSIERAFVGEDIHLTTALLTLMKEPKILAQQIKANQDIGWFVPLIEAGICDGTIRQHDPRVLIELIFLLINFWLLPTIYPGDKQYAKMKVLMIKEILDGLGCPLLNEELLGLLLKVIEVLNV